MDPLDISHPDLGFALRARRDLKQRDLNKWGVELRKFKPKDVAVISDASIPEWHCALFKSAITAGVMLECPLKTADVDELDPWKVRLVGVELDTLYTSFLKIPPNSSLPQLTVLPEEVSPPTS